MKTEKEIEQLAQEIHYEHQNQGLNADGCFNQYQGFIKGYTQCQEDMALQGKCLSGKNYDDCHIHSSNIFGCLSCGNFERNKQD